MLDEEWFAEFYRRRYPAILEYGVRRVGPEAARDLAAEVFLVVWRRGLQLSEAEELPWLYTTARCSQTPGCWPTCRGISADGTTTDRAGRRMVRRPAPPYRRPAPPRRGPAPAGGAG